MEDTTELKVRKDELKTDPQSLHTYHCTKKHCKLSCVDYTSPTPAITHKHSSSSGYTYFVFHTLILNKNDRALYFVHSRVRRWVRVVPSGSAERCAMSSLWVSILQPSAAVFLFLCSAFFVTGAVRGRTPRDRISLQVYLSALLDGTGLGKLTRNRKCERRNQKCTWVTETMFLTNYLCELVVIN